MRPTHLRVPFLLFALVLAVPLFAAVGSEITLPVSGYLELSDNLIYRTELTLTNHRNVAQYVSLELITEGHVQPIRGFVLQANETLFLPDGGFHRGGGRSNLIAAMRIRSVHELEGLVDDSQGMIEANSFVVAEHPISRGATRQEVAAIPASEYHAEEAVFLGVRHSPGTGAYTNVGITNLHPTQTETFFVQFELHTEPVAVVVPPLSLRQIRISGPGNAGRSLRITPEWAVSTASPARTTPWVAYASTVDTHTGDAYSGMRAPAASFVRR